MAKDNSLLIAAPILQDILVGKDGLPLAAGTITLYQDNSRTTLKNWYYQSGTPGNYTWIPLQNPMTLSAAGTIIDNNGNDTIPFFYPYATDNQGVSEKQPYFIVVKDSNGELQFTRANFPFLPPDEIIPPGGNKNTLENYIINNRFWRNFGSHNVGILGANFPTNTGINYVQTGNFKSAYNTPAISEDFFYITLAPSQNDGFSMPDYNYIKNANDTDAVDETITFTKFPDSDNATLQLDVQSEFYVNHNCISNVSGATLKVHQFPIEFHIGNLIGSEASFTLQARTNNSANTNVDIYLYQFLGTGVVSPPPIFLETFVLSSQWQKYPVTFTFPGNDNLSVSDTADDAWYIQIGMPVSGPFNIDFTLPSLYLSAENDIPTNNFESYDQIDTVISKPRTGDIRTSLNQFYFYGWVPMSNGTIGYQPNNSAAQKPTARNNQDTWPLFNLIWNLFSPYSTGSSTSGQNLIAQMYTTGTLATPVGYGPNVTSPTTAYGDWIANRQIALTRSMGQVLLGTVPVTALIQSYSTTYNSAANVITVTNNVSFFNGMPVYVTGTPLPTGLAFNTVYYVSQFNGTNQFHLSTTFSNAINNITVSIGTITGSTAIIVAALSGTNEGEYAHRQLIAELAAHTHGPLAPTGSFIGSQAGGTATLTGGSTVGAVATTGSTGSNVPFNITQPGTFNNIYIKL